MVHAYGTPYRAVLYSYVCAALQATLQGCEVTVELRQSRTGLTRDLPIFDIPLRQTANAPVNLMRTRKDREKSGVMSTSTSTGQWSIRTRKK